MKLHELNEDWDTSYLSTSLRSTPNAAMTQAVNKARQQPNHKYVGSGAGAYVGRKEDPHEMDNIERISDEEDGTALYLKTIAETPELAKNPFFPRVRQQRTENGVTTAIVERLVPFTSDKMNSIPMLQAVWEDLFNAELPPDDELYEELTKRIEYTLRKNRIGQEIRDDIKNPQFKQAIEWLHTNRLGTADLHDGNIMWRITGNRPQLVITDPFS